MRKPRIRFMQNVAGLAKIEGTAEVGEEGVDLELAMTESVDGPVKGVLKRSIPYSALQEVRYTRRFLRKALLRFVTDDLETFDSIPGASAFEYIVHPLGSKAECQSFVNELKLAMAEATMEHYTRRIEGLTTEAEKLV